MRVHRAFRLPGRTRRINHIGEVPGRNRADRILVAPLRSSSPSRHPVRPAWRRSRAIPGMSFSWVSNTGHRESSSMKARRSLGYAGSSGTYAPPALRIASSPHHHLYRALDAYAHQNFRADLLIRGDNAPIGWRGCSHHGRSADPLQKPGRRHPDSFRPGPRSIDECTGPAGIPSRVSFHLTSN